MKVFAVDNYNKKPTFGINLQSKKLRFKEDDFYVRIKGYGHHSGWAKKIIETADNAVVFIREKCNFDETLQKITSGVKEANQLTTEEAKQKHTGILRTERKGWVHGSLWDGYELITKYGKDANIRYRSYTDRLDYTTQHPLKNPYNYISLSRPIISKDNGKYLSHGNASKVNNAFEHIDFIYNKLYKNFIQKEATTDDLNNINSSIAEIRWILAHATPWERGSDAISNTFIRAIYKAMGVKAYPLKKGVSLDLEAYCTNLDEYKKNFVSYFSKKPKIID